MVYTMLIKNLSTVMRKLNFCIKCNKIEMNASGISPQGNAHTIEVCESFSTRLAIKERVIAYETCNITL